MSRAFGPMPRQRIRRTRRGDFELNLPQVERDILRSLPSELRGLLASDDPAAERLFPPAHPDDPGLEAGYRDLVRDGLVAQRITAAEIMAATIDARRLDEDELGAWLGAVNDLRLVLGTRLGLTEDPDVREVSPDDPEAPAFQLYDYLTFLEDQIVQALAGGFDEETATGPA